MCLVLYMYITQKFFHHVIKLEQALGDIYVAFVASVQVERVRSCRQRGCNITANHLV